LNSFSAEQNRHRTAKVFFALHWLLQRSKPE